MTHFPKKIWFICAVSLMVGALWLISNLVLDISFVDLSQKLAVTTLNTYLAVFFAVVGLRYVVLICFSFMEHIDNLFFERSRAENGGDVVLPFISIVIPAFNEGLVIQQSIRSLLQLDYPNYEILVIDDGSTDDTYARAQEIARREQKITIRVITKPNGGKADALNVGMARARGEFVLNMDGDTMLSSNALRMCIRHFDDPKIGAVAGNIKVYNRENLLTCMQALEYVEGLAMARKAQSYARICNIIPGPLGMFRKSTLMQVGGYDHDTFAEDCDLTLKMLMLGWHVGYEPAAIAWVETPSKVLDLIKQRYRWSRGVLQAIAKHRKALWHPKKNGISFFILWYMLFENLIWPLTNVVSNLIFIYIGLNYGVLLLLLYWWVQLTLLDIIAAIYCVVLEKEDVSLVLYAPLLRVFYILFIDVVKMLANLEELWGTKMSWGKLDREGKL
ncbi:MAG: glycosyltransferase family 2 protein [Burkholderiaceae bacterium]